MKIFGLDTKLIKQKLLPMGGGSVFNWLYPNDDKTKRELLQRYEGTVYACVRPIALAVSKAELYVNRTLASGKEVNVPGHSFLTVFNKPNKDWTKNQFLQVTWTHKKVVGEAFWYMVLGGVTNRPKEFHILRPDLVDVVVGKDENGLQTVVGYVYTQEGTGDKIPLDKEEVVHFKEPNPWNIWRGCSAVQAGYTYVMTEKYGAEFTRNFIANNAMPAGIINMKGTIDPLEFEKIKRKWNNEYGTVTNAGKTAFLQNMQVEFVKVGTNLSEIDLTALRELNRDDVMMMFGVSKPILGILTDVNLASAKASQYIFAKQTVEPEVEMLVDTLESLVTGRYNPADRLGHIEMVPEDEDQDLREEEALIYKVYSINDVRRRHGLDAVEGGDFLYVPTNQVEAADTNNIKKDSKIKSLSTVTIRQKKKPQSKQVTYEVKENFRQTLESNTNHYIRLFQKQFNKYLDKQAKEVIGNLPGTTKAAGDGLFDYDQANADIVKELAPIMLDLTLTQGQLAIEFAGAVDLSFTLREAVKSKITQSLNRMARNYNEETIAKIKEILNDAIAHGQTTAQLTKRISEEVYGEAKGFRSERVARTETLQASTEATKEAYRQTGFVVKLEWFTNPGACQFCQEMQGRVVGIEDNFLNLGESLDGADGGSYNIDYNSIDGPPLHPNCTCTILPVRE